MRGLVAIICLLSLSACTKDLSGFHPTMEADPAETGAEGFIYMNEMGKAYTVTTAADSPACEIVRESFQDHERYTIARYKVHPKSGKKESARSVFKCFVFKDVPSTPQVRAYLTAGFALSDLYCRTFFRRIALHSSTRSFDRSAANDIGTAASAVFGLANAGSAATGLIGAAGGLADSAFRDYDSSFLVSTDLPTVEDAVLTSQSKFVTDFLGRPLPNNYNEASMAIQAHAHFCTFNGMKSLVSKAVKKDTDAKAGPANVAADERKQAKAIIDANSVYAGSKKTPKDEVAWRMATEKAAQALKEDESSPVQ